jgi:CubicO group peptidase (beta-lactamase class C family)
MTIPRAILSLGLAACVFIAARPAPAAPDDAVYQARFAAMMAGRDVYDPLEPVPGAPHPAALPLAHTPSIAPEALAEARAYALANRSKALLIWRDGALQSADYFAGATAQTPLVSKSLAKPLTAIVIGRAIELGYIRSLDQPVSDFIGEWRNGPKAAIKLRYLLDMRSGLLAQSLAVTPEDILNRVYLDPHHQAILIHDYPLTHAPGTRFDYANAVADLVAIVIERATHERYARFVSREVLRPLGAAGGSVWIDRPGGLAHSACCILLPAETWLRLAVLLIDDGRWNGAQILPRGFVDEMKRPTAQNPYYGLGVYVAGPYVQRRGFGNPDTPGPRVLQSAPYLAKDLFLFDGNADQVVYIIPSQRLIILRMGDAPPKSPEWDNAWLPNTVLRGLIRPAPDVGPQPVAAP